LGFISQVLQQLPAFGALTLLVECQEEHSVSKNGVMRYCLQQSANDFHSLSFFTLPLGWM